MDIKENGLYKELVNRKSAFIANIDKVYKQMSDFLPKINRVFINYTGHGIDHSLNVMEYMFDLVTDIEKLSELELTCLIYVALLHDVGMVVSEEEIRQIQLDELVCNRRKYSAIHKYIENDLECIQECVRPVHGERSYKFIMDHMMKELFVVPTYTSCSFQEEVAKICQSHTVDVEDCVKGLKCKDVIGDFAINAQYIAMLLRIADSLDLDEKRAPIEVYRFLMPQGYSDEEWQQHYIITNRNKIEKSEGLRKQIVLYGQSKNPKIHNKFLKYLDRITAEIGWWVSYSKTTFQQEYWLLLEEKIDNRIETIGFEVSDFKLNMDYGAIVNLLMGEKVYGDKKYGLRELIQNSLDACKVMKECALQSDDYKYDEYIPKIQVILDYSSNQFRVRDNGIGMSEKVLKKYFLNVGKSYYKSSDYIYQGNNYNPIGNFGIGFLACFMLSKEVYVETKNFKEKKGYGLEIYADSEYICQKESIDFKGNFGTMISLNLEDTLSVFDNNPHNIVAFIQNTFLYQDVDIDMAWIDKAGKRKNERIDLKSYKELACNHICLDSYLDDIDLAVDLEEMIYPKEKMSQLDISFEWENVKLCRYDEKKKILTSADMKYSELKNYLHNNSLMLVKISGIKKKYRDQYYQLKNIRKDKLNYVDPREWKEQIVFPITYNDELEEYYGTGCNQSPMVRGGYIWGRVFHSDAFWVKDNLKNILGQCDLIDDMAEISVKIEKISLLEIDNERCIELKNTSDIFSGDYGNIEVYLKGIKLERAQLYIDIDVWGIFLNKIILNIKKKDIVSNIARDDLSVNDSDYISRQIQRAVYRYILDHIQDPKIKDALEKHIKG